MAAQNVKIRQASPYTIAYSTSPDRSSPISLDDRRIFSSPIYVFVTPTTDITSVKWYKTPSTDPYRTDSSSPFDLIGSTGANADPFELVNIGFGEIVVTAVIETAADRFTVSASFEVGLVPEAETVSVAASIPTPIVSSGSTTARPGSVSVAAVFAAPLVTTGSTSSIKGDYGSPGAETVASNDVLWQFTGSKTGADVTVDGSTVPAGFQTIPSVIINGRADSLDTTLASNDEKGLRPKLLAVSGKSWTTEIVSRNPGPIPTSAYADRQLKGHAWRMGFAEHTIAGRTEAVLRYGIKWPAGMPDLGDMKMPSLLITENADDLTALRSDLRSYSDSNETTLHISSVGLMSDTGNNTATTNTSNSTQHPGQVHLKRYFSCPSIGGTSYWSPNANYSGNIPTTPNGSLLLLERDTWYEILMYVKLNTSPSVEDGIYELYVTAAGGTRTLRSRMTNIKWADTSTMRISTVYFRSFWGGPASERPWEATTDEQAPHFRDFVLAKTIAAVPALRST